ncbi:MAG: ribonuclease Z [Candidatus Odinarchaeota archaeon]
MRVHFLGVGGGIPSLKRALSAIAIYFRGNIVLFDCGEGTQTQLKHAKLSPQRIIEVFISHLHGDHILGLPGLLSTMAMLNRSKPLTVYGPIGIKEFIEVTLELTKAQLDFELTINEVEEGTISHQPQYQVDCLPALHNIPSLSFILRMADTPGKFDVSKAQKFGIPLGPLRKRLQQGNPVKNLTGKTIYPEDVIGPSQKGMIIAYSGDSAPNPKFAAKATNAQLLIHDATFSEAHRDKAAEFLHSTAAQAAQIAVQAKAKQLALVHISPRYIETEEHETEAKVIFPQSFAPKDLDVIYLDEHG